MIDRIYVALKIEGEFQILTLTFSQNFLGTRLRQISFSGNPFWSGSTTFVVSTIYYVAYWCILFSGLKTLSTNGSTSTPMS